MDTIDPSKPLDNPRWEMFCQHLAGDCWGRIDRAYVAAGYSDHNQSARRNGHRLMTNDLVRARVGHLRAMLYEDCHYDALQIINERIAIARTAEDPRVRMEALRDIERSRGLLPQATQRVQVDGAIQHSHTALPPALTPEQDAELRARVLALVESGRQRLAVGPGPEVVPALATLSEHV